MIPHPTSLLIFGTSHVGKSTLAARLGAALGWQVLSTDSLARHPGRPWPDAPQPVQEYYARLSDEAVYWFLQAHYENIQPLVDEALGTASKARSGVVLEGSALRPERIARLDQREYLSVGLYADRPFLLQRMRAESAYFQQDEPRKTIFDKFITRSLRDNTEIVRAAREHGLNLVDVSDGARVEALFEDLTNTLARSAKSR